MPCTSSVTAAATLQPINPAITSDSPLRSTPPALFAIKKERIPRRPRHCVRLGGKGRTMKKMEGKAGRFSIRLIRCGRRLREYVPTYELAGNSVPFLVFQRRETISDTSLFFLSLSLYLLFDFPVELVGSFSSNSLFHCFFRD